MKKNKKNVQCNYLDATVVLTCVQVIMDWPITGQRGDINVDGMSPM